MRIETVIAAADGRFLETIVERLRAAHEEMAAHERALAETSVPPDERYRGKRRDIVYRIGAQVDSLWERFRGMTPDEIAVALYALGCLGDLSPQSNPIAEWLNDNIDQSKWDFESNPSTVEFAHGNVIIECGQWMLIGDAPTNVCEFEAKFRAYGYGFLLTQIAG